MQILDSGCDILNLALIRTLQFVGLTNHQVEDQLDPARRVRCCARLQPASTTAGRASGEADSVVASRMSGEGKAARRGATLGDDTVVIGKGFLMAGLVDGVSAHRRGWSVRRRKCRC